MATAAIVIYLVGVAIGLIVMRDPWLPRTITALLWPLGPLAFVIVVALLTVSAAYLWPVPVLLSAAVVALLVWLW